MERFSKEGMKASLFGLLIGDALGVPVEFKERDSYPRLSGMVGYGSHNMPPGTWSDDGSMTLCTLDSLKDGYDLQDMKKKFCDWLYRGLWTYDRKTVFDVGATTARVLHKIEMNTAGDGEAGEKGENSNGNGSLMRILPLAFYVAAKERDKERNFKMIEDVSGITHAHIRSKIACSIYIEIALLILNGHNPREAYEEMKPIIEEHYFNGMNEYERKYFSRLLDDDIASFPRLQIKSSGYVIDTLEAAIWCLLTTDSFTEAVLEAVNLGEDTDTVGAVTGGLAGLFYGPEGIPGEWKRGLARIEEIEELCEQFYASLQK